MAVKTTLNRLTRRSLLSIGAAGLLGCAAVGRSHSRDRFNGDVIIIGAGPAGMVAAHLLRQQGIRYRVLEADSEVGGRIKHNLNFTDFPISLGAEWVHIDEPILEEIVNDAGIEINTILQSYGTDVQSGYYEDGTLELYDNEDFQIDRKFIGSSWMDFFTQYILPGISGNIELSRPVTKIDYSGERISVSDTIGNTITTDRVIVTAPLKIMQRGDLTFNPPLPSNKRRTIDNAIVWSGIKAFIEFDTQFYPTFLNFSDSDTEHGQRLYYDAAYGQNTTKNIVGLFAVGAQAERYQAFTPAEMLIQMLRELDTVFDGMATRSYVDHIVQNWNEQPYAGAAYLADVSSVATSRELAKPVDNRLYFAGEAYTSFDDWGSVHAATRSAFIAVDDLLARA